MKIGLLITPKDISFGVKLEVEKIKIPDGKVKLEFYYKNLECNTIDVVCQNDFDIYVDDEGLLKSNNIVMAYNFFDNKEVQLAGNLLITNGTDRNGNTIWFDDSIEKDNEKLNAILNEISKKSKHAGNVK